MWTSVKIARRVIIVENWDAGMFLDHVILASIVSRDLRFLIRQMLLHLVGHALSDIIALQELPILWAANLEHTMIAQASLIVHHVVQGTTVHQTRQHVCWSVQWVITVLQELKHLLITLAPRDTSTIKREGKAWGNFLIKVEMEWYYCYST